MPANVLLIADDLMQSHYLAPSVRERLAALPATVIEEPVPANRAAWAALLERAKPRVVMGAWTLPALDEELLAANPQLDYVCLLVGSFRHRVPESYLEQGHVLTNWGDATAPTVAECALALTLACMRRFNRVTLEMHVDRSWIKWGDLPAKSLYGRKVGVHGFGAVARKYIQLVAPFGVEVSAWSDPVPPEFFAQHGVRQAASLAALFSENDVVVEAEALTPETRGSVTAEILNAIPPGSVFVNVGRGAVVDEAALIARARKGDLYIGLDVYVDEPVPEDSPLRGLRNVMLNPHAAGPTLDHYEKLALRAVVNLEAYLRGETPPDARTVEDYRRST